MRGPPSWSDQYQALDIFLLLACPTLLSTGSHRSKISFRRVYKLTMLLDTVDSDTTVSPPTTKSTLRRTKASASTRTKLQFHDWIFCPHFAHFLYKLPGWVSFYPDGVSLCPEYHLQPLLFTQSLQTPFGDMYEHKTPPAAPQTTPFPGLNLKVGKLNYSLG